MLEILVLILVLMEDTLRVKLEKIYLVYSRGLNPCFNGRYSQRALNTQLEKCKTVLILVLMEDISEVI